MIHVTGECVQCGYCCQNMAVPFDNAPDIAEWLIARGWKKVLAGERFTVYKLKHRCPHLDGANGCKVHNRKPAVCRNYPHNLVDARLLGKCKGYKVTA
jgi:Fe-S-cluster containining protein